MSDAYQERLDEDLDPGYVAGAVDLLGVLGYEQLATYQSLAVHAFTAPDLDSRVALCRYAAAGFDDVRQIGRASCRERV